MRDSGLILPHLVFMLVSPRGRQKEAAALTIDVLRTGGNGVRELS
jgi:hypothetical protein